MDSQLTILLAQIRTVRIPADVLGSAEEAQFMDKEPHPVICKHVACASPVSLSGYHYGWCGRCVTEAATVAALHAVGAKWIGFSFCKQSDCHVYEVGACRRCRVWAWLCLKDIQDRMKGESECSSA
ncbi:hypothetical protein ACRE_053320 [Hapsidospora chrysogenum ATCC 11550]|uniref:Uncharacterized protein n=1 Tax=Hapsidospora chrysogenum (strain ATCC 11550 / CBS 779.69 / DSM 880 / IAM 14645 / JCM 23072 / IMI 49137) TaxID=857340 RepID=A0A086T3I3_HAPC1|nr:hypothetical protein ACRE_053320 [Hapsidospora chrysogenum ATCC 11550]